MAPSFLPSLSHSPSSPGPTIDFGTEVSWTTTFLMIDISAAEITDDDQNTLESALATVSVYASASDVDITSIADTSRRRRRRKRKKRRRRGRRRNLYSLSIGQFQIEDADIEGRRLSSSEVNNLNQELLTNPLFIAAPPSWVAGGDRLYNDSYFGVDKFLDHRRFVQHSERPFHQFCGFGGLGIRNVFCGI